MLYWLYTDAARTLSCLLAPSLCGSIILPVALAYLLGRGIQRSSTGSQTSAAGWRKLLMIFTYLTLIIALTGLYTLLTKGLAVAPRSGGKGLTNPVLLALTGGPASVDKFRLLIFGSGFIFVDLMAVMALREAVRNGGWLREKIDRMRRPGVTRGAMGSAHLCTSREYRRFRHFDKEGVALYGAFWGKDRRRLDFGFGRFCLSGEDIARGILTIGGPGAGKSAGVIKPIIADRMLLGHSLIVADPQGKLALDILEYAKFTGHLIVIHDPTASDGARYNLAQGLTDLTAASIIAKVLIPPTEGDNKFWSDAAAELLSASLLRFDNLGEIKASFDDLPALAKKLGSKKDEASPAGGVFIASVNSDGKLAANIVGTLGTALSGWASLQVCENTSESDFDANLLTSKPAVVVLQCPEESRKVYGPYLGATLEKLMGDVNAIAKKQKGGRLKVPISIILDEFPAPGKLDNLVGAVNMIRNRRISVLIAAQSKGQFHRIYGQDGTKSLFTGLATQIVYGGGDHETAKYYSEASGTTTADADPNPQKANFRQRPLLTADEIVTPLDGDCTIFARYSQVGFATQVVLNAQLTRIYERDDWNARLAASKDIVPTRLAKPRAAAPALPPTQAVPELPALPAPPRQSIAARMGGQPLAPPGYVLSTPDPVQPEIQPVPVDNPLDSQLDYIPEKPTAKAIRPDKYAAANRARKRKR